MYTATGRTNIAMRMFMRTGGDHPTDMLVTPNHITPCHESHAAGFPCPASGRGERTEDHVNDWKLCFRVFDNLEGLFSVSFRSTSRVGKLAD